MYKLFQSKYHFLQLKYRESKRRHESANYYRKYELNNPGDYGSTHCFDYYKCIFIHIPKTAGLSISKTLFGNYAGTHLGIDHYIATLGRKTVNEYFKFTFVRNPWERLYSAFSFLKQGGINEEDIEFENKYLSGINTFESFVMNWLDERNMLLYWHFIPQFHFITLKEDRDKIMIDFIGRFENLEADFEYVCKVLKISNRNLGKVNRTKTYSAPSYVEMYSTEMIEKVAHLYEKDISLFNYSFGKVNSSLRTTIR
jgi:hypothetical protein